MNGVLLGGGKTRKESSLYIYGTLTMCQALSLEPGRRWNYLSWHRAGLRSPNSSCRLYSSNASLSYRLCPFLLSWPAITNSKESILLVTGIFPVSSPRSNFSTHRQNGSLSLSVCVCCLWLKFCCNWSCCCALPAHDLRRALCPFLSQPRLLQKVMTFLVQTSVEIW